MRIDFVTLFPDMFAPVMDASILGRAQEKGLLEWGCVNPRDFSEDKHHKVDDRPFGGGPGMVMMVEPLEKAVKSVKKKGTKVIFLSPQGETFTDGKASQLAKDEHLVLVCGRYEGIDERALDLFDEELSIGDYVLTGGELPAMVVADAVVRKIPGVLKKEEAAEARRSSPACSISLSTLGRASGAAARFRRSFSPATTRRSRRGGSAPPKPRRSASDPI